MVRGLPLAIALLACGGCRADAPAPPPSPEPPASGSPSPTAPEAPREPRPVRPESCAVTFDSADDTLRINGTALADYRLETLKNALGEPDRVEQVHSRQRYEEYGAGDEPSTSTMVDVNDQHYVYDDLGLVFHTRNSHDSGHGEPEMMLVFFDYERHFTSTAAPDVIPTTRGVCTLVFDGHPLDPSSNIVPAGTTYQTEGFELLGRTFGPTSIGTQIDSLYGMGDGPMIRIYLDDAATRRPSYMEIAPLR